MLLLGGPRVSAELPAHPLDDVPQTFGRRDDVEGGRHGAPLLEVADPQLATGELPLRVSPLLKRLIKHKLLHKMPISDQFYRKFSYRDQLIGVVHHRNQKIE